MDKTLLNASREELLLLIEELQHKCSDQDKTITKRNEVISSLKETQKDLNKKLEQSNHELEQSNHELEQRNHELEQRNRELAQSNQELKQTRQELEQNHQELKNALGVCEVLKNNAVALNEVIKNAIDTIHKAAPQVILPGPLDNEIDVSCFKELMTILVEDTIRYIRRVASHFASNPFGSKGEHLGGGPSWTDLINGNSSGTGTGTGQNTTSQAQQKSLTEKSEQKTVSSDTTQIHPSEKISPELSNQSQSSGISEVTCHKREQMNVSSGDSANEQISESSEKNNQQLVSETAGAGKQEPVSQQQSENTSDNKTPEQPATEEITKDVEQTEKKVKEICEKITSANQGVRTLVNAAEAALNTGDIEKAKEKLEELKKQTEETRKNNTKHDFGETERLLIEMCKLVKLSEKIQRLADKKSPPKPNPGRKVNHKLKEKPAEKVSSESDMKVLTDAMKKLDPNSVPEQCIDPKTGKIYKEHAVKLLNVTSQNIVTSVNTLVESVKLYEGNLSIGICEHCGTAVVPYPDPRVTGMTEHGSEVSINLTAYAWGMYSHDIPVDRFMSYISETFGFGHTTIYSNMELMHDIVIGPIYQLMLSEAKEKLEYGIVDETSLNSLENTCRGNSNSVAEIVKKNPELEQHYYGSDADSKKDAKKTEDTKDSAGTGSETCTEAVAGDNLNSNLENRSHVLSQERFQELQAAASVYAAVSGAANNLEESDSNDNNALYDAEEIADPEEESSLLDANNYFLDDAVTLRDEENITGQNQASGKQDEKKTKQEKQRKSCAGYVLAITSHPADDFQVSLFVPVAGRGSDVITTALDGFHFKGMMRDGYTGYREYEKTNVENNNVQVCGIHFRRPIYKLLAGSGLFKELSQMSIKEQLDYFWNNLFHVEQSQDGTVTINIGYIQLLSLVMVMFKLIYRAERSVKIDDPEYYKKIADIRAEYCAPIWAGITTFMNILVDMHCTVNEKTGKYKIDQRYPTALVLSYWLKNREYLGRFLKDPRLRFDTLDVERIIRPITVLRKNINYFTSEKGRRNYCEMISLAETARLYGVDDFEKYLSQAACYAVWIARRKMIPELWEKFREDPKYFENRKPLYLKNIRNYTGDIDWTPFLPWNLGTRPFTENIKNDNSKRRFRESMRRIGLK